MQLFLRDKPDKWLPCWHEQTFVGQRAANSEAVSCPQYRGGWGRRIKVDKMLQKQVDK